MAPFDGFSWPDSYVEGLLCRRFKWWLMTWTVVMFQPPSCNKPLLEKRRRARINRSLDQLKLLLLESSHQHVGLSALASSTLLLYAILPVHMRELGLLVSRDKRCCNESCCFNEILRCKLFRCFVIFVMSVSSRSSLLRTFILTAVAVELFTQEFQELLREHWHVYNMKKLHVI